MKIMKKLLIVLAINITFLISWNTYADELVDNKIIKVNHNTNINTANVDSGTNRNSELDDFWKSEDEFFSVWSRKWWQWIFYTLVNIAQSLKNIFFVLATLFYLIISIKLLVANNTEDEVAKFKKAIIWVTIWLMIMQMAYSFTVTLYAKSVWESLAFDLIDNIINPLIWLMEVLASIFFIAIAIFAYYRMVTANWKEEEVTRAKMSILYAVMWFVLIKIANVIVSWVYWRLECKQEKIAWFDIRTTSCISEADINWLSWTIMQIINWANWFIWVITILLIIYAWINILFSAWDEEKVKKGKNTILYIGIWLLLLSVNYLLLTFFIIPDVAI